MVSSDLSAWAIERFGEQAPLIRERVGEALVETIARAEEGQIASGGRTYHPYGAVRYVAQYEELVDRLSDIPSVEVVRPFGKFFRLVIANGNLLWPFRWSEDLSTPIENARISTRGAARFTVDLFAKFGPTPPLPQLSLLDLIREEDAEMDDSLEQELAVAEAVQSVIGTLPSDTRLVLLPFACNPRAGLLALKWGEAALLDRGNLSWIYHEAVPFSSSPSPRRGGGLRSVTDSIDRPSFTAGAEPFVQPTLKPRDTPVEAEKGPNNVKPAADNEPS